MTWVQWEFPCRTDPLGWPARFASRIYTRCKKHVVFFR
ncbi:unnamed protein product [Callosobruchus maculatus]|uniref:Uncharacterized protein n=1 Tax=Callosobruchus maculatus TaxID=64391 RepID=A0A653D5I9_CALMS|nr:unnamed protein product [Callosobruchus maculatus]